MQACVGHIDVKHHYKASPESARHVVGDAIGLHIILYQVQHRLLLPVHEEVCVQQQAGVWWRCNGLG